jgi:glycosyltransferase involved in cell wall biosynthesis
MRLGLISGGYPPDLDGIGDYTWWLARTLASQPNVEGSVRVFTALGPERTPAPGVEVVPFFDLRRPSSFGNLLSCPVIQELDWLVLQYNPFSFGARGWCPWVPRTLARLRRLPRGPKIAVMFHETVVPRWPWKFALMRSWQQPIFRALCRTIDVAFVSTERWRPQVLAANPTVPCDTLPVGPNVPLCELSRRSARESLEIPVDGLVLGVFGSAHASRRMDWIGESARMIGRERPETSLLYVGPDGPAIVAACDGIKVIDAGIQSAADVGRHLRAMDIVLSPFIDGVSSRRGSVIAALQHGIPVATTLTRYTDDIFRTGIPESLLVSSAGDRVAFAEEVLGNLRARAFSPEAPSTAIAEFFARHFSWDRISKGLLARLYKENLCRSAAL